MNPVRNCVGCGASDDHPRHVVSLTDGNTANYHMDCHVLIANCDVCEAQLEGVGGVKGNPKGDDLREHLLTTGPGADQPGWTAPVDETVKG
jgi:hypothetical protein